MIEVFIWVAKIAGCLAGLLAFAGVAGFCYERYLEAKRTDPLGQRFDVGGRKLHLICAGTGTPSIIWEAGGGSSSVSSRRIQALVSEFSRVCTYDRAGYGWSDPVQGPRTFDEIATDLENLIEAAQIPEPYILVGESMGGLMARRFAVRNLDKVAAVVFLDSAEEQHTFQRIKMLHRMQASARVSRWLAKIGLVRLIVNLFPEKVGIPHQLSVQEARELADDVSRERNFHAAELEMEAYFQTSESMRRAGGFGELGDAPLVVVTHGQPLKGPQAFLEKGWAEAQERLVSLSSNGKLVVAEDSGHAISLESPSLVVEILRSLVTTTRAVHRLN